MTVPVEGDAERRWLRARAAAVRATVEAAPGPWRSWAMDALYGDAVGQWLDGVAPGDPAAGAWDRVRGRELRATLGQVFTPPVLAGRLVDLLGVGTDESRWPAPLLLDPACGSGSLLVPALDRRREAGWSSARALAEVEGWDRDPVAAWLCRARLVEWALERPEGDLPGRPRVFAVDALADHGRPDGPVGAVVSNPPYLEAKRMRGAEPGLKERLRTRFPQLSGAFDLYLAFAWLALEIVADGGEVALLIPNKVCQGRYATGFREAVLSDQGPSLLRLVDLSRAQPRPFPGTGVYPVMLHLARREAPPTVLTRRVANAEAEEPPWVDVARSELRAVGGESPVFAPLETWPLLAGLLGLRRLGEVAELRSTCSFHARGLRERYICDTRGEGSLPYLGLYSRARRTEVEPFRVRWEGGWIDYDADGLRALGNPLPDLERTFQRPKVIWCQHALRMRAVADPEGRWVTKDTYPIGWPTDPGWNLDRLVAVLNSTVFTALYNTIYQGIVVGGETYHYLPAFLAHVPVPPGDHPALADVAGSLDRWLELDRRVTEAYGLTEEEREALVDVHLRRVGAEVPGEGLAG